MAEKIFKEVFCEKVNHIKVCTTTADMNFDNYTEPGTYEIYEDMGNDKVRLYFLTVDRSESGDCVTQTRMYCGKIEYRQADGSGEWTEWKGVEPGEGEKAKEIVFVNFGDNVTSEEVTVLAEQGKIVIVRESGIVAERIAYFFDGTSQMVTFYGHLSADATWFVRLTGDVWSQEIVFAPTKEDVSALEEQIGDIESALDEIIALQNSLIGGDSE